MIRIHNLGELEMPRQVRQKARRLLDDSTLRVRGRAHNASENRCQRPPCCRNRKVVSVGGYRVMSVGNCREVDVSAFSVFLISVTTRCKTRSECAVPLDAASIDRLRIGWLNGFSRRVPRGQKMLKGHLTRVIYHQLY